MVGSENKTGVEAHPFVVTGQTGDTVAGPRDDGTYLDYPYIRKICALSWEDPR
jgi:hypothetical protein